MTTTTTTTTTTGATLEILQVTTKTFYLLKVILNGAALADGAVRAPAVLSTTVAGCPDAPLVSGNADPPVARRISSRSPAEFPAA